ncbi:MAG: twin-arginine translocation signal domain-containing protein [bacterium]
MCSQHGPRPRETRKSLVPNESPSPSGITRRGFLGGLTAGAAVLPLVSTAQPGIGAEAEAGLPKGKSIRVLPALVYHLETPQEKTSWRSYGEVSNPAAVEAEAARVAKDLQDLAARAGFPIEMLPVALVKDEAGAQAAAATDADLLVMFAAGGSGPMYQILAASPAAPVMFIRHKTRPYYLWHEIAHWRFLRRNEDSTVEPNMTADDIVTDDYNELLWRMRAVYGLKNAKGTKMLAIGSLAAYSEPGQRLGPGHARDAWDYAIEIVPREEFARRLDEARADSRVMEAAERRTRAFLERPGVTLQTERRFVVNSFLALGVCEDLLREKGASNFGFDLCMGRPVIEMLDTPPCLILALANDEGYTAYCHTDLTHTCAGVLLRWIAGKPTFVCNTHFPHDGLFTVAHCAAPMRMSGTAYDPVTILTHYESDYGAASQVHYPLGQTVTVVIPNLHCTKWQGFRGTIVETPSLPACRSQMNIEVDGDRRALLKEMEGFHAQVVYGDYLKETGYALRRLGKLEWRNFSETA